MPMVEVRSRIVGTANEEQPSNVGIDLLNDSLTVEEFILSEFFFHHGMIYPHFATLVWAS